LSSDPNDESKLGDGLAKETELTYLVSGDSSYRFSLDPADSDFSANQNLLDHLISTLVKYGPSGHLEPYLARRWETSNHDHRWTFWIRTDLKCEDGSPISAKSYVSRLNSQLRNLSQTGEVMDFDLLEGWDSFKSGSDNYVKGVVAQDDKVIFNFLHRPDDFLDTLRKVYFGYWCEANFVDGKWKDPKAIVSSGAYRLAAYVNQGAEVTVSKRQNWFSFSERAPDKIRFTTGEVNAHPAGPTVAALGLIPASSPDGFHNVQSIPTWLIALVLHGRAGSIFSNRSFRKLFAEKLRSYLRDSKSKFDGLRYTETFFPGEEAHSLPFDEQNEVKRLPNSEKTLKFVYSRALPTMEARRLEEAIRHSLHPEQRVEFSVVDRSRPGWVKPYLDASNFDVRIQAVDVGGAVSNSAIKMMFCTKLGVSFPDVSGQVCKLVRQYDENDLKTGRSYSIQLNRILRDDSEVVPLFHTGLYYLYSTDIDPNTIAPQLITPRFDLLTISTQ
jgi:MarR-like DNA-binding transcriptional regulator SgrR of sgrS sRNA